MLVLLGLWGCASPTTFTAAPEIPRIVRLSHSQWENSIADLLALQPPLDLQSQLVPDAGTGWFDNDASAMKVTTTLWQGYQAVAEAQAVALVADRARYNLVVPNDPRTGGNYTPYNVAKAASAATFNVPADGLYRVSAAVVFAGSPPLSQLLLTVDGVVRAFDVDADDPEPEYEYGIRLSEGAHEVLLSVPSEADVTFLQLAVRAVEDPLGSSGSGEVERDAWIRSFGRRAFRRRLTEREFNTWTLQFDRGAELIRSGDDFADGVNACVTAFLQSPNFLYRIETSTQSGPQGSAYLTGPEVATRLSYTLWNSTPDDSLLDVSEHGVPSVWVDSQVARMLEDPRAHGMIRDFHRQLLHVDDFANILTESPTDGLPIDMQEELYAYVDEVVFSGGGVAELFTSRRTFVNASLAPLYGISGVQGDALQPVDLDASQRSGLLTLSGMLSRGGDLNNSNPIQRGAFINLSLLCVDLPPPPEGVTALPPEGPQVTNRQRVEDHTSGCGGACHNDLINPVGLAYEHYGPLGVYRDSEGGSPVNAQGSYPFAEGRREFNDAIELSALFAQSEQVHRCYIQQLLTYLEGRPMEVHGNVSLGRMTQRSLQGASILDLIEDRVRSEAFRPRTN